MELRSRNLSPIISTESWLKYNLFCFVFTIFLVERSIIYVSFSQHGRCTMMMSLGSYSSGFLPPAPRGAIKPISIQLALTIYVADFSFEQLSPCHKNCLPSQLLPNPQLSSASARNSPPNSTRSSGFFSWASLTKTHTAFSTTSAS